MASCVLKRIIRRLPALHRVSTLHIGKRAILSDAHCCHDAWAERRKSPVLQKVEVGDFAVRIQDRLDHSGVQAIDMDILANKLDDLDGQQWDFVQNLFYRFRQTDEAANAKESSSHAIIRALVKFNETEKLFEVLSDKANYGVFLDDFSALFLFDHFLKKEQWYEAAQVAYDMMLQEDYGHPLVRAMSQYSCIKHWKNPTNVSVESTEAPAEDEEEQWIPVKFIRNPWYDDHFDIKRDSVRLGKTLTVMSSVQLGGVSVEMDSLNMSCTLIGRALHEKYPEMIDSLREMAQSGDTSTTLAREATEAVMSILEGVVTKERPEEEPGPGSLTMEDVMPYITGEEKASYLQQTQEVISQLETQNQITDQEPLDDQLLEKTKQLALILEQHDINSQKTIFKSWEEERMRAVKAQLDAIQTELKKEEIAKKLVELQRKEERLSYFEEKQKILLGISKAPVFKPIKEAVEEEQFVAPPTERGKKF